MRDCGRGIWSADKEDTDHWPWCESFTLDDDGDLGSQRQCLLCVTCWTGRAVTSPQQHDGDGKGLSKENMFPSSSKTDKTKGRRHKSSAPFLSFPLWSSWWWLFRQVSHHLAPSSKSALARRLARLLLGIKFAVAQKHLFQCPKFRPPINSTSFPHPSI